MNKGVGMGTRDLLEKRCRRGIAVVLSLKEHEADPFLPPEVQQSLRKVILDQFNDLLALSVDLLASLEKDSVVNELWLERLDGIHAKLERLVDP
jgi:hypothetical protein